MSAPQRRVLAPLDLDPRTPGGDAVVREFHGLSMGTTWSVKCAMPAAAEFAGLQAGIEAQLERVVKQMSTWEADSDLSRYNQSPAGSWSTLPAECFHVLRHALAVAEASNGAYDPTSGPLVNAWGFGPGPATARRPDAMALTAARRLVGWQRVEIERAARRIYQNGDIYLDLSAIAKGYGVDAVMRYLRAAGIAHALVEVGGELRGQGMKPDGLPWWVVLENPPAAGAGVELLPETVLALHGLSVATSGDYRRYFMAAAGASGPTRYSHTIDPRSGEPISHGLAGVTVVHPECMVADVFSTALNVLGATEGLHFASARGIAARFVQRAGDYFVETLSPAFAELCR